LVRDPEHSRVQVLPGKRTFDVGEDANVSFRVLGRDYQPVAFAQLRLQLLGADGTLMHTDDIVADETGNARHTYPALPSGAYRVKASATHEGEQLGEGSGVFIVESSSIEMSRATPRHDLLEAIAEATDGKALAAKPGVWQELRVVDPEVVEIARRRNVELWDNGWALLAGVLLLAADWALRRRRGYL